MSQKIKVSFELVQDDNGYPPEDWETVWATKVNESYACVDNIPFYARGVSPGDIVNTRREEGLYIFTDVVKPSSNSVFRIYVSNESETLAVRNEFRKLGCESEQASNPKLFALEVPGKCDFAPIGVFLMAGSEAGRWDFEEASMRHPLTPE